MKIFNQEQVNENWDQLPDQKSSRSLAVYIHIPYCLQKCLYCDFYSIPLKGQKPQLYVETVLCELESYLKYFQEQEGKVPRLTSLFIGGGTPTCLPSEMLVKLIGDCLKAFDTRENIEVTVEANPGTIDGDLLAALKAIGVNRLSLGVQTLDPYLLKKIGRIHTAEQAGQAVELARGKGFENINLDLIYGLPDQTLEIWQSTVERVLTFNPEHLSAYSLKVETGTPFFQLQQSGKLNLPDEDLEADMFDWLVERVADQGYQHYEISNFAKPGCQSMHNQVYWRNQEYLGLGPSAHSCLWGVTPAQVWAGEKLHTGEFLNGAIPNQISKQPVRFGNWSDLDKYLQLVTKFRSPVGFTEVITPAVEKAETMFLGLRLMAGVSKREFKQRFGETVEQVYPGVVERLIQKRLLWENKDFIALSPRAILIANQVFQEFLP